MNLIYSSLLKRKFITAFLEVCIAIKVHPNFLMACIAFETAETFSPSIRNKYTGATGLIQFMPQTATALDTSTNDLSRMTAVEQLYYVKQFYYPISGKLKTLDDVYMAILWPEAIGKPPDYILFNENGEYPKRYFENAGLDLNHNKLITKAEASEEVHEKLIKGQKYSNFELEKYFSEVEPQDLKLISRC
jgi:hypothetical protein